MGLDSYNSPEAETLLAASDERYRPRDTDRRETITNFVSAGSFLIAASLLAALGDWQRSFSLGSFVLVLLVWLLVERARFPFAAGWTYPTMLAFIPALFLLPTPLVPLTAMAATLIGRVPDMLRGEFPPKMLAVPISDCWYAVAPALVLTLAGEQRFSWSHWPLYLGALGAYVVLDVTVYLASSYGAERISPRAQLPLIPWVYAVDVALAPLGLAIAAVASVHPPLVLLAASPMVMLLLFARERQQRMDETLALSTAYRGTALLLGDVVEADDHYTGTHSRQVVDLAVDVATQLGLSSTQKRNVEFAALLHDVGKIHVPKEIINKPGPLDDDEWAIMHQHTIDGERMLKQVGGLLADVGTIVRGSHERWDGTGYPDGLVGDATPIEARIVSTCDAYSAMTTDRSYRKAMSIEHALAELRRCAGTHFDPAVVAAVERALGAGAAIPAEQPVQEPWQVMGRPKLGGTELTVAVTAGTAPEGLAGELGSTAA